MMQKKILLATDFSPCSEQARLWATEWAKKAGAFLHIFHKVTGAPNDWRAASLDELPVGLDNVGIVKGRISEISKKVRDAGVPFKFVFSGRGISGFIQQYIEEEDISYVFMGTHGKQKSESGEMGSNALKTLTAVTKPVLVAKESDEPFDLDNFVYASNFDADAKIAFSQILEFVSPFKPEIHFLNIEVPRFLSGGTKFILLDAIEDFKKIAADYRSSTHFYKDRKIGPGIIEFCNERGVDLIAFSESGKTLFGGKRFAKPVEYLVRNANQPVLFVDGSAFDS